MAPQTAISKAVCYKTKNEQLWEKAVHFFLLPPTVFMQVYQLFFAPLPEMLNFCPLCVAEVYALRCDAMLAGTSRYPLHRPSTTY